MLKQIANFYCSTEDSTSHILLLRHRHLCQESPSHPSPARGAGAAGRAPVVAAGSHGAGHALLGPAVTERPGLGVAGAGRLELGGLGVEVGEVGAFSIGGAQIWQCGEAGTAGSLLNARLIILNPFCQYGYTRDDSVIFKVGYLCVVTFILGRR